MEYENVSAKALGSSQEDLENNRSSLAAYNAQDSTLANAVNGASLSAVPKFPGLHPKIELQNGVSIQGSCNEAIQQEYVTEFTKQPSMEPNMNPKFIDNPFVQEDIPLVEQEPTLEQTTMSLDGIHVDSINSTETDGRLGEEPNLGMFGESVEQHVLVPQASQAPVSPMLSVHNSQIPLVMGYAAMQPLAMVGVPLQQHGLPNLQMTSNILLPQQMVSDAGANNIQAFCSMGPMDGSFGSSKNEIASGIPNPQNVVPAPNIMKVGGVGGIPRLLGLQPSDPGIFGTQSYQLGSLPDSSDPKVLNSPPGAIGGFGGLQSIQYVQGLGCLPNVAGVQGVTGLLGLPGAQGVAGLQSNPNIQGLPSVSSIPISPGIQGLPGVGGFSNPLGLQGFQGLQTLSDLQGTIGLYQSLLANTVCPVQTGLVNAPQLGLVGSDIVASSLVTQVSPQHQEEPVNKEVQLTDGLMENEEERCPTPDLQPVTQCTTLGVLTSPHQVSPPFSAEKQRGRSRRKQTSPARCVPRSTDSKKFDEEARAADSEDENYPLEGRHLLRYSEVCSVESNFSLIDTAATSELEQQEIMKQPWSLAPRPGTKLSRKVQELMSASEPQPLGIDCSPEEPAQDEAPSPQTWRRFLEREKQRNDRLREVEEKLAELQQASNLHAHWAGLAPPFPKACNSKTTQVDGADFAGCSVPANEVVPAVRDANPLTSDLPVGEPTHDADVDETIGQQIQQETVTSSGDSVDRNLQSDVTCPKNDVNVAERAPISNDARPHPKPVQMPLHGHPFRSGLDMKIVNRPKNYWLNSTRKKVKISNPPSVAQLLSASSGNVKMKSFHLTNGSLKGLDFTSSPSPAHGVQATKKQVQVPSGQHSKESASVLSASTGGQIPRYKLEFDKPIPPQGTDCPDKNLEGVNVQLFRGSSWETEGLSKIERNRIRAREGMRRHRERKRMAKLCYPNPYIQPALAALAQKQPLIFNSSSSRIGDLTLVPKQKPLKKILPNSEAVCNSDQPLANQLKPDGKSSKRFSQVALYTGNKSNKASDEKDANASLTAQESHSVISSDDNGSVLLPYIITQRVAESFSGLDPAKSPEDSTQSIDWKQEPYKSLSSEERNRIRAREGMRRYRERLKMARNSHQAQKAPFVKTKRGHSIKTAEERSTGNINRAGKLLSYSELVKLNSAELLKRRRTYRMVQEEAPVRSRRARLSKNRGQQMSSLKGANPTKLEAQAKPPLYVVEKELYGNPEDSEQGPSNQRKIVKFSPGVSKETKLTDSSSGSLPAGNGFTIKEELTDDYETSEDQSYTVSSEIRPGMLATEDQPRDAVSGEQSHMEYGLYK